MHNFRALDTDTMTTNIKWPCCYKRVVHNLLTNRSYIKIKTISIDSFHTMSTYAENNDKILYATALDNTTRVADYPPIQSQVLVGVDPEIFLRSWLADKYLVINWRNFFIFHHAATATIFSRAWSSIWCAREYRNHGTAWHGSSHICSKHPRYIRIIFYASILQGSEIICAHFCATLWLNLLSGKLVWSSQQWIFVN